MPPDFRCIEIDEKKNNINFHSCVVDLGYNLFTDVIIQCQIHMEKPLPTTTTKNRTKETRRTPCVLR